MTGDITAILDKYRSTGVRIDLGCGENKQFGFVGVDARALPGVDVVHDLEEFPWPLPDGCAELVVASHLIEHINPAKYGFIKFMDEVWRILAPNGTFMASAPYAGSPGYWQDPTHINPVNEATWAYFAPGAVDGVLYAIYKPKPWAIIANTYSIVGNIEVALQKLPLPDKE